MADPLWGTVATERRELAALLDGLTPEQWAAQSLCAAWTVQGVVAHLVSVQATGALTKARAVLRAMGSPSGVIEYLADEYVELPPAELVALLREHADGHVAPPGMGARAGMTDVMVHRVDIVVPLGLHVERPPELWRPVLELLTGRIPQLGTMLGARPEATYVATDLDWRGGRGPEVTGPAEALATVIAGRPAEMGRLDGPGAEAVRAWVAA
ncbi:maleylpyruvate isomerase family mycothiol-dependent enzyme [Nocardioides sp. zg-DK7169]|uniref:maleylpyruvate isomerase family mycothiol-dependent enzyme n=1 Tax=Nocardioides sp. zg-DK7169 TaxID=2736600 RepID=UPI001553953E|nr:maleylpyruvate isomerase family mycothiol-dependent enzyme [Nocardioides sp. zg-DK7169]NPC97857.1 maleylpyruvate isomerase family mycothiol-dependent enzyme [Nocardioides sp. zg-DK7169]